MTNYRYDDHGSLSAVLLPAILDSSFGTNLGRPTYKYTYDLYGNLATVGDPLSQGAMYGGSPTRTTSYTYEALGHKVTQTLPLGQTESWKYNALGQLDSTIDFDGQKLAYMYDSQGRVTRKDEYTTATASTPSKTVTYTYDNLDTNYPGGRFDGVSTSLRGTTSVDTTTSHYDVNGNLVEIESPQGTVNYRYNLATGQKIEVSATHPGGSGLDTDILYAYDELGRLQTVTVDKLDGQTLGTPLLTSYTYDKEP